MTTVPDASTYRIQLCTQLLDFLEADAIAADPLLKLARRLANSLSRKDVERWLGWELAGYPDQLDDAAERWMIKTGRRLTRANSLSLPITVIHREALPRIEDSIIPELDGAMTHNQQMRSRLKKRSTLPGARQPKFDESKWEESQRRSQSTLIDFASISRSVRTEVHRWVSDEYHRSQFGEIAEAIFLRYKAELDTVLSGVAPELMEKLPTIYDRLRAGTEDSEAIAHAMVSCRRMITDFADAVQPPSSTSIADSDGLEHRVTKAESLNRIRAYVSSRTQSKSRGERIHKVLAALHDRASSAIKNDMTAHEAQALFVLTYVTLGEVASLPKEVV